MLKKQNRLTVVTRRKDDQFFSSPLFNVRISGNNDKQVRFAFIVSKAIDKRAVVRNKIKRGLRNAAEELLGRISQGKNIVVIAKINILTSPSKNLSKSLEEIFSKAQILK